MSQPVVTRFAPSPTGYLHIGGARTALFNWLYARANQGRMLLRIEDTDRARSTDEAVDALLDGLSWLGIEWDGEPVSQFARAERHGEVVNELLAKGAAYRCWATAEELTQMREQARADKRPPRYDNRWRDRDPAEGPAGVAPAIRLRTPLEGETVVDDIVQGEVRFPNADLEDFVLLRSDGTPTYMLAVVVDDHDMGVTHIVRGDDHLTNAAKQTLIYEAMGWDVPKMAHVPLIYGPDGAKLSKRHGAVGAEAYRAMGYLPEALRLYLVRLGWAHGDQEMFTQAELDAVFGLEAIGKSPARFDFAKLENINGQVIRATDDEALLEHMERMVPEMEGGAWYAERLDDERRARLLALMPGLKERAKTLVEMWENARFLFEDGTPALEQKAEAILDKNDGEGRRLLGELAAELDALDDWSVEAVEGAVRGFAEARELGLGKVAQPVRAALTGRTQSPGVFDVMAALPKGEALRRMRDRAQ